MRDTTPAAADAYFQLLRNAAPAERLRAAIAMTSAVRALAEAGIRERHAGATDDEINVRLAVRLYGRAAVATVFASIPDDAV